MEVGSFVRSAHNHDCEAASVETEVVYWWLEKVFVLLNPFVDVDRISDRHWMVIII